METHPAEPNQNSPTLKLLCDPESDHGAGSALQSLLRNLGETKRALELRMGVWRNDAVGAEIGRAILETAERGVAVRVIKDRSVILRERTHGNRSSFFHSRLPLGQRLRLALTGSGSGQRPERNNVDRSLGETLRNHPNVTLDWAENVASWRFVFDERVMIMGCGPMEDSPAMRHDYAIEIAGEANLQRLGQRLSGKREFDPERSLDFLTNQGDREKPRYEIKKQILRAIAEAKYAVYVEMAAMGDPEVSLRLIGAARHGVRVKILTARTAEDGAPKNYRALKELFEAVDMDVYLSDLPVQSKLMLFDWKRAILGSADLSGNSMESGEELDIVVHNEPEFLRSLDAEVRRRLADCERADSVKSLKGC